MKTGSESFAVVKVALLHLEVKPERVRMPSGSNRVLACPPQELSLRCPRLSIMYHITRYLSRGSLKGYHRRNVR